VVDQKPDVRVVRAGRKIQPAAYPSFIPLRLARVVAIPVVNELAIIVVGVHEPPQRYLLAVVHAVDALSLLFGPGQGGQQERRQDGNDGDDHQQFDQGETRAGRPAAISFGPSEEPGCPGRSFVHSSLHTILILISIHANKRRFILSINCASNSHSRNLTFRPAFAS